MFKTVRKMLSRIKSFFTKRAEVKTELNLNYTLMPEYRASADENFKIAKKAINGRGSFFYISESERRAVHEKHFDLAIIAQNKLIGLTIRNSQLRSQLNLGFLSAMQGALQTATIMSAWFGIVYLITTPDYSSVA